MTRWNANQPAERRTVRGHVLQLAGPGSGTVAMIGSWLIAVPRIRALAEELGVALPAPTRILVDHAGTITTIAVIIATLGIVAIELSPQRRVRIGISIATSLVLLGLFCWDIIVFWLLYVATLEGIG